MDIAVALGEKPAASKHGLTFGGKVSNASLAALSLLSVDCLDIPNEKNLPLANFLYMLKCDHPLAPFGNKVPKLNVPLPPSVCEIDTNPLAIKCPCSPFGNGAGLDINDLEEVSYLLDLPDEHQLNEINNMIDLPDDMLFDAFRFEKDERFQNGLCLDMVSWGQYFYPVVHTGCQEA
jgi:hypothetical protein